MSIEVMRYVWGQSKSKSTARLALLAIADNANEVGDAFPGIERLAGKCNASKRTVQEAVHELERMGELQVFENAGMKTRNGYTNLFRVVMPDVAQPPVLDHAGNEVKPRQPAARNRKVANDIKQAILGQGVQTVAPLNDEPLKSGGVQTVARQGVQTVARQGVQTVAPESPVYPSGEPKNINTISPSGDWVNSKFEADTNAQTGNANVIKESAQTPETPDNLADQEPPEATPPVPPPPPPKAKNALQEAVAYAFGCAPGGYAALLGQQLTGSAKKGVRAAHNIEPAMTPPEIIGMRLWYASTHTEKPNLPASAELLWERVLQFRDLPAHDHYISRGQVVLDKLLAGKPVSASTNPAHQFVQDDGGGDQPNEYMKLIDQLAKKFSVTGDDLYAHQPI